MAETDFGFVPDAATAAPGGDFGFTPQGDPNLARIRAGYSQELNDPYVAGQLYALTQREVGTQGPEAQQAFMETVFNRAAARGLTLSQTVNDRNYYPAKSLRPAALAPEEIVRYRQTAGNAIQGSNISNYATGNASGNVGFAGGPQTLQAGGERFGIEGPDRGWVPRARPADVQEVYIERGEAVTPVEMEVRRAKPVGNQFGFMPDTPTAGQEYADVPTFAPQTVDTTGPDIFASPEAYGQSVSTGQDFTPEEMARANELWQTRLVKLPRVKAGDTSASGQKLSSFDAAAVNMARNFASGLTSLEGLFGLIPPVGLAELAANAPHLIDQVHAAEQTPAWSQDRWEAGLGVITSLAGAGLLGEATLRAGAAPKAVKPGTSLGPAPAAAEAGAAPPPTAGAGPAPTGEAPAGAAAAAPPRTWANVAEELRWLAKNDPAKFKVRFAEEMAKRQQGHYDIRTETEPVGAAPAPAGPAPEAPAPAAAVPTAEAPAPVQSQWQTVPEESRTAITDELAARGHSPNLIAQLTPAAAANLVLHPAPDEVAGPESVGAASNPAASIIPEGKVNFDILDHPGLGLTRAPKDAELIPRGPLPAGTIYKSIGKSYHGNPPSNYAFTPDGRVYSDSNRSMTHGGMSPWVLNYVTKWYDPAAVAPAPAISTAPTAPAAPDLGFEPDTTTLEPDYPITEVPLGQITLSKDVPQFKAGANEKGVVEPLAGKYERVGTPPVQLWQRNNGDLELISGRHRLDLAQRTGERSIPAQIHREADGFGARQAARIDAEINIRDNQGSVADYANYFKNSGITPEAAEARGLLARGTGKAGFSIARGAGESLFALHQSARLTDAQAQAITEAAPGNEGLQRVGIKHALEGGSGQSAANLIRALNAKMADEPELSQPDLLGASDTAMQEMSKAGQRAGKIQRELGAQIIAVEGAARHPGKAKALGVNVEDPASVVAKARELKALQERARRWDMDDQIRNLILHSDMSPEQVIKALSKPTPETGQEDLFNVAETPPPYAPLATYREFTLNSGKRIILKNPRQASMLGGSVWTGLEVDKEGELAGAKGRRQHIIDVETVRSERPLFMHRKYGELMPEPEPEGEVRTAETPPPYAPPVPAASTAKLVNDIQTFLDFNKVPPPRKAEAAQEIKNTVAKAGDPALQAFYESGFGIPGPQLAAALRANKNRVSIVYTDLISRELPTWNIEGSIIATPADFAMAVQPLRSPDFESVKVVVLDSVTKRVLAAEIVSSGTVSETIMHQRDVFRAFARIKEKYPTNVQVIVSHNHPSGFPQPSAPDRNATARMHEAASAVGVALVDHIITDGKQYFSFDKEEVTGDGFGTLPAPVKAPWEVVRQEESLKIQDETSLRHYIGSLRADDPNAAHIFYVGTRYNLKAVERVPNGTNMPAVKRAVAAGIAREAAYAVLVDFGEVPARPLMINLVATVTDGMGAKILDAYWPGMDSAAEAGGYGLGLREEPPAFSVGEPYGATTPIQRQALGAGTAGTAAEAPEGGVPRLAPLSEMERTKLETLRRSKASLTRAGKRDLARMEARLITQGELLSGEVFNLTSEQGIDWVARQAKAEAEEAAKAAAEVAAQKAQMHLFEQPDMPYVTGTARVNESNGAGQGPPGPPRASMFAPNTPPGANPLPLWARRYAAKLRSWWREKLPRSYEIVRKVPASPAITEHQRLLETELAYLNNFTVQPWWQALRRRPEEELVDLEHQAVMAYRQSLASGTPRDAAWAQAVAQMPPDVQALFQYRESRVPTERWAAAQLAVDEPSYTGDPYMARLTNEEGKAVVDLHPQIANWGRHIRQSIGSFDKSRVHATMKEGIQNGTQYEPPTLAAFVRELYSARLEGTAKMLQALKRKGVLFDDKAEAIAAGRTLPQSAGPVTLVRGFGGKDYWARTRVEAQFLEQNLNTTGSAGAVGKMVRVVNAFARNPNLMFNPLPHATKNMAFKYALARIGNYTLRQSAREFGTDAQMRARFEAVMPLPATGVRLPQLRALEAGSYLERLIAKGGKWLSGNYFSSRFNFAKADPALRYALWKTYLKKGLGDQEAANHVWVDLIRYDENSGALNFWRGIPFNFFATWRLGTYISLVKQLRSHPIRTLLFIGAVEYLREIIYRKYGWWTHLPVDYVDAPLAEAVRDPRTIPGVAATTLLFGPGGAQAPHTINDVMKTVQGDPGMNARVVNMFWGLSQLFNIPQEFNAYLKDKDPKHLALILSNAAFSTHSALKYEPHRLMQWLPESLPGLEKSAIVRQAEALRGKIEATQEKARETYERRHGIGATLQYRTEASQMEALRRAAGVHPPPPGPPKRTRILPSPRKSTSKPRGF